MDDIVTITLTADQFQTLLIMLGAATETGVVGQTEALRLVNAINGGNLNWTPYDV